MAATDSLKAQLHQKLNDFSSLTRRLLETTHGDKSSFMASSTAGYSSSGGEALPEVLDRLIDCDKEIQKLVDIAITMRIRQRDIEWTDSQLERRQQEIQDLQNRLHEAEKLLEIAVFHGKQKMESIQQAEEGAVEPEVLIKYSHMISQASSVVSPLGWQPSDPRRPYPLDVEMKQGLLGKLSMKSNTVKTLDEFIETEMAVELSAATQNNLPEQNKPPVTFGMLHQQ